MPLSALQLQKLLFFRHAPPLRRLRSIRRFSSQTENVKPIAEFFSSELKKNPDAEPLPLPKRLDLSFSHITINPTLLLHTLDISPAAGRTALDFLKWANSKPDFQPTDEVYSYFVHYFGSRKDFEAAHQVLVDGRGVVGVKSLEALVHCLVRAGRPIQALALFEKMEKDYGFLRNMDSCKLIVSILCEYGYASYAEKMVKSLANDFSPDEYICDALINADEAKNREKIGFLMGIGLHRREIDRIFVLFPGILSFGVENRLKPLLVEFQDLGFALSEVRREVLREPKVLGLENGELSHCVEMLRTLKCRAAIKEIIFRDGELRAGYKVKLRVDCLSKHGLIYRDAFTVLWKEPRVILYEIDDIKKKIDFLVHKMKFDIQCIVEVPEYLGVNFDKQIVPRFNVIEHLRSNGGLGDKIGLRTLVRLSRLRFYNMYVKPYPECEKIYGRFAGDVEVRSRHPVGMWKLFKPQQYPESGLDVKNIKSFIESLH